jgi:short-subunit dehydrogenase
MTRKPRMHGHIVNVSSGQVFFKLPTWGAYTASKAALAAASEAMHHELKRSDICVTTVYPFMVNTGFYDEVKEQEGSWGSKMAMKLLPYYSYSPKTVAKQIFKAIEGHKRVEMCSLLNYIAKYAPMGLVHNIAARLLMK